MPYPKEFPYQVLGATPDDTRGTLKNRLGEISAKHPDRVIEADAAFQKLFGYVDRLSFDILLITGISLPEEISQLAKAFAEVDFLPERINPIPISFYLTELAEDPTRLYRPVSLQPKTVTGLEHFVTLPQGEPEILFDI